MKFSKEFLGGIDGRKSNRIKIGWYQITYCMLTSKLGLFQKVLRAILAFKGEWKQGEFKASCACFEMINLNGLVSNDWHHKKSWIAFTYCNCVYWDWSLVKL
jgi:hypothetical protein